MTPPWPAIASTVGTTMSTSPAPPLTAVQLVPAPTPITVVVQSGSGGGLPWGWVVVLGVGTILATLLAAHLLRRTGKGTVAAAERSSGAAYRSNELTSESIANAVEARLESRIGALELDKWRRREETMRLLRWAAEQATAPEGQEDAWRVGLATLQALGASELLQPEDQDLIDAVLVALYEEPADEYAEGEAEGGEPDVVLNEPGR